MLQNPQNRRVFVNYYAMTLIEIKVTLRKTLIPNSVTVKRGDTHTHTHMYTGREPSWAQRAPAALILYPFRRLPARYEHGVRWGQRGWAEEPTTLITVRRVTQTTDHLSAVCRL